MKLRVGAATIAVEQGDITQVHAEAVVNHLRQVALVGFDAAAVQAFEAALRAAGG